MFKEMKLGHLKVNEDKLKLVLLGGRKAMKKLSEGGGNRTLTLTRQNLLSGNLDNHN